MNCCTKKPIIDRKSETLSHICPSKLSKRELQDLYYTLLQNNLELKKKGNQQSERIKILSTKLQRMIATQRTYVGKDIKDCCASTKRIVEAQRESIAELKKHNDQLREHIKQLTMKLCSTKQFLQGKAPNPLQSASRISNLARSAPTSASGEGATVNSAPARQITTSAPPIKKCGSFLKCQKRNCNKDIHVKQESDIKEEIQKETDDKVSEKDIKEVKKDEKDLKEVQRNLKKDSKELKKFSITSPRGTHNEFNCYSHRNKIIKMNIIGLHESSAEHKPSPEHAITRGPVPSASSRCQPPSKGCPSIWHKAYYSTAATLVKVCSVLQPTAKIVVGWCCRNANIECVYDY
ncbi:uncharacterized protein LOC113230052 [Hyposmocoma kahamanoa]|uniref:uncharacterized protein LOC113230052 n=1 Tax=Hyposmocoma kahamanoa TaxID=1477025 RepID=UPI000E6D9A91|nr:uncharacterized protein LOC113230052 [Hyposmocoma kahamanoa]